MGVTIHYALGMKSGRVKTSLDRTQALAKEIKREQAAPLSVPFAIRRPTATKLLIDIGGCETLAFDFNAYETYIKRTLAPAGTAAWSYEQSVLSRTFEARALIDKGYMWAGAFCKTQYAGTLAEHRWVAELIRSIASVADHAHVVDEGDYYNTLEIEDAAEAIHENGLLINSFGAKLEQAFGKELKIVRGGETKIAPARKEPGSHPGNITN